MRNEIKLLAITLLFTSVSCKKDGTGGKAKITGTVAHHSTQIPGSIVYIKYGASEFPGKDVSKYDAHVTAASPIASYEINNLLPGNYYVYAVGYDISHNDSVFGGVPVVIERRDKKKSITANIAVVE
jgi:hypothetical protein